MTEKKVKGKMKATVSTNKGGKAIKPKLGRGTGGFLMTSIKVNVEKRKKKKNNG